jgi:hypothetical protein
MGQVGAAQGGALHGAGMRARQGIDALKVALARGLTALGNALGDLADAWMQAHVTFLAVTPICADAGVRVLEDNRCHLCCLLVLGINRVATPSQSHHSPM